ncbi:hypothetical protein JOF56_002220 [Kibdelosporangium banguiense]|uniref:S-adenosyl methyltransferase n=1 Tax=Kibdelosporangium banguiense TaxID=1365924 RepID=A0ABS4TBP8_9PSEU|nr:SAM-dependent methyltransferase [Kibdelosporangium banguiense]MBP2321835.1 hypothetical protein [Kibdelosporangium banguiense]
MTEGEGTPADRWKGRRFDPSKPSISRVYDALLGGKENFQADRDVRDKLVTVDADVGQATRDLHEFLLRATRFLAREAGVTQFLMCGLNFPAKENLHEVALRANRSSSVVYVARDPAVLAHGRALLADNDQTHMADAHYRFPRQVIEHPTVVKHIDFTQPVALYQPGTMRYLSDELNPIGIMAEYIEALPSGSYVILAHLVDPGPGHELYEVAMQTRQIAADNNLGQHFRTRDQILAMLNGLDILDPGLVPLATWWPDGPRLNPLAPLQRLALGAVAHKP